MLAKRPTYHAMVSTKKHRQCTKTKMIITEFLPVNEYKKFGDWLKIQDEETRQLYFGVAGSQHVIETLMERV